jgi:hypothetical protein
MRSLNEPPIGIIVTLPEQFFREYGVRRFLTDIEEMNKDEERVWYRVMKNLPKEDFLYIYVICLGKVRYRFNFVTFERNQNYWFDRPNGSIKEFENANAIVMAGPVVKAPYIIKMKGFQGFRYLTKALF